MNKGPVLFAPHDPASWAHYSPWKLPDLNVTEFDPPEDDHSPECPVLDERVDRVRATTPLNGIGRLVREGKPQTYECDAETVEVYKARKKTFLESKKRPAPVPAPPTQQAPLPVDAETLEQVKRIKRVDEIIKESKEVPVKLEKTIKEEKPDVDSPPKRVKIEHMAANEQVVAVKEEPQPPPVEVFIKKEPQPPPTEVLIKMEPPPEEVEAGVAQPEDEDPDSSAEVKGDSAVVDGSEDKAPDVGEQSSSDSSFSSDLDLPLIDKIRQGAKEGSSSSSSSSDNTDVSEKKEAKKKKTAASSSMDSGESSDGGSQGPGGSMNSGDSVDSGGESSEAAPSTARKSKRKSINPDPYNAADFPDEEEKKGKKKPAAAKAATIKVPRPKHAPSLMLLSVPASRQRDKPTTEKPIPVNTLMTVTKFTQCGSQHTRLYTIGWCQMANYGMQFACETEYAEAKRTVDVKKSGERPMLMDLLSNEFRRHLFEENDTRVFESGSLDVEELEMQRLFYVYRDHCVEKKDNGWTEISLWDPYTWAMEEKGYAKEYTFFVKTDKIDAFTNYRIALNPLEYIIYRARKAIIAGASDPNNQLSIEDFYTEFQQKNDALKLGWCNDWSIACQLAGLDIFPDWKSFDTQFY